MKLRDIRKRSAVIAAALGLGHVLAGTAFAADPTAGFPAGWSHVQINVVGPRGKGHTLIYDRGRVQSVTSSSVTLKESDATIVTIQVAPNAVVRVNGRLGSFSQIVPGFSVRTLGVDGLPAKQVVATSPPPPPPVITTTTGRVRAVTASSVTLREANGVVVTVQVAPTAVIRVNGRAGTLAQIHAGFRATTVAANGAPARRVQATAPAKARR